MAWPLSRWMMLTRIFQLLGALASAGLNGFLTAWVSVKRLGLTQSMCVLELLICILLLYTVLALILQNTGKRTKRKGWLVTFVSLDILFCAVDIAIVCMLSRAGLPDHCHGMTKADSALSKPFDADDGTYFTTPGFSDESAGQKGQLDRFCGYERSFFIMAVALVFTYIVTIVLGTLSIYETTHTKNTRVAELLNSLDRAGNVDLKLLDSPTSPLDREPGPHLSGRSPAPPSEGIITRTASLRSTLTSLTSSTTTNNNNRYTIPRRPIPQQPAPPLPPRRLSVQAPGPSSPSSSSQNGFVPVPLDEHTADALVTNGMHPHHQFDTEETDASLVVADGLQHQQRPTTHRRGPSSTQPNGMPMLPEEDTAESALVSDGMRPSEPMLPPYEPGRGRTMEGHGDEDNEMRLSGYVKGETRAQDMKDSGRY